MRYWLREAAGWFLVALGLVAFNFVYEFCNRRRPVEAGILTLIGIFIFRGGIHLLKVAVAARICQQAQDRLYPAPPAARPAPPAAAVSRPGGRG
jgi:hypothetical protein